MAAAADERAEQVRAAHQAKLARAEQQAALAQQRKLEQAAELKKRSQLVAARNQEIHQKRCASDTYTRTSYCIVSGQLRDHAVSVNLCFW